MFNGIFEKSSMLRLGLACTMLVGCGKKSEQTSAAPTAAEAAAQGAKTAESGAEHAANGAHAAAKNAEKQAKGTQTDPAELPAEATVAQAVAPIAGAELQALLDGWIAAQTDGDFEAYSAFYAARFFGVKRSGARTRSFQREGWLRDRKRMFSKAMAVSAAQVEMTAASESAVIAFEQTWASGSYKDIGPKQLVIVREGDKLRIARESMLRSEIASGQARREPLSRDDFAFVVFADESAWLVLDDRPDSKLATGAPKLLSVSPFAVTLRAVPTAKAPKPLAAMVGPEMRLLGHAGQVCRGHITELAMMARVKPHFGTVAYWKGDDGAKPLAPDAIAREAWSLGDAGRLLVGRVTPVEGDNCRGALWGRKAELPEPPQIKGGKVEPLILRAALREFHKLRGFKEIQKAYVELTKLPRPALWDAYEKAAPQISVLESADGQQRFVSVAVQAGAGCGDFLGEYWAIWRVRGTPDKPTFVLLSDELAPGRLFVPRSAADVDGDGKLEFISTDAILQPVGPVLRETEGVEVPDLDCPC